MNLLSTNGFLLVNKPRGLTSFKVLSLLKKQTSFKKLGHTGTLDPFATGLLVVGVGEALKYLCYLQENKKVYEATLKLGELTNTLDCDGEVTEVSNFVPDKKMVEKTLETFLGDGLQVPPMFSAKKIEGEKLYDLARAGINVERKPCAIHIEELTCINYEFPYLSFKVSCSKGTYVRQLGLDIAQKMGTVGHLTQLKRISSGSFLLDEALDLEQVNTEVVLKKTDDYLYYPVYNLTAQEKNILYKGQSFSCSKENGLLVLKHNNVFMGMGEVRENKIYAKRLVNTADIFS